MAYENKPAPNLYKCKLCAHSVDINSRCKHYLAHLPLADVPVRCEYKGCDDNLYNTYATQQSHAKEKHIQNKRVIFQNGYSMSTKPPRTEFENYFELESISKRQRTSDSNPQVCTVAGYIPVSALLKDHEMKNVIPQLRPTIEKMISETTRLYTNPDKLYEVYGVIADELKKVQKLGREMARESTSTQ